MKKKFKEWLSIYSVKKPERVILWGILLLNLLLLIVSAVALSHLAPKTLEHSGFWDSVFYTISMIFDAGCIQFIISDIGDASVTLVLACLAIILIGMITFTGSVIGYVTTRISDYITSSKSGKKSLKVSGHTVILNWNSRASEIVNDLLYTGQKEIIVILTPDGAEKIEKELDDRLSVTLRTENDKLLRSCEHMSFFARLSYMKKHRLQNQITLIVREGDTYSTKELMDISLLQAKDVIILGRDTQNSACKYEVLENAETKGNANTIKTLIQVAEITGQESSADNQVVIVEVDDYWTASIVNRIISHKEKLGKCNIVAVPVNTILGQIFSQFSIMPELNFVYSELFSNKGSAFYCFPNRKQFEKAEFIEEKLKSNIKAIPLTIKESKDGEFLFYVAEHEKECAVADGYEMTDYSVKIKENYWLEQRNVVIVGHNSNSIEIMDGFDAFRGEWNKEDGEEILNVIVVDDAKSLERRNYYKDYPYVKATIEADLFDGDIIKNAIREFVDANEQDTSILILSDDAVASEDIDANALTYLIYVQDIISEKIAADPDFDRAKIDVIVEIVNPKNYDVVRSYSVNNVIISNRYISKMITQISRNGALYEFYKDILSYDEEGTDSYESEEMYIKKTRRFFDEIPEPCTAAELVRAVYDASPEDNKSIVIGYVDKDVKMHLFNGDQRDIWVELTPDDKLILFSNH